MEGGVGRSRCLIQTDTTIAQKSQGGERPLDTERPVVLSVELHTGRRKLTLILLIMKGDLHLHHVNPWKPSNQPWPVMGACMGYVASDWVPWETICIVAKKTFTRDLT